MKCIKIISVVFLFAILSSCKNDELVTIYQPGLQEHGWATGLREGLVWEASGFARKHTENPQLIGIDFGTVSEEGALREVLSTNDIPLAVGHYEVKYGIRDLNDGYVGGNASIHDADVIMALYSVNNDKKGFIEITDIDTISNVVSGNFELFYTKNGGDSFYPSKLEIKDGEFEVEIIN